MKIKAMGIFLALAGVFGPAPTLADHIPESILTEVWREANVPYCQYENRVNGTDFDCAFEDPDWISCYLASDTKSVSQHNGVTFSIPSASILASLYQCA